MAFSLAMVPINGPMETVLKDSFVLVRSKDRESLSGMITVHTVGHGCRTVWRAREFLHGLMGVTTGDNGKRT